MLGLSYGAIDMIVTPEGEFIFLEVNPHGAWLWIENEIGTPIAASLAESLCSNLTVG
jgi:glutathione synthase/RimK-type ligase-like ATP-grasp enzyme